MEKHFTIGYIRSDGDLEVLATLNNSGDNLSDKIFEYVVEVTANLFRLYHSDVQVFSREDSIDVLTGEDFESQVYEL